MSPSFKQPTSAYRLAHRAPDAESSIIDVQGVQVGGQEFVVMAGPCSVESSQQVLTTADAVARHGAAILRGGVFKPRSSPYSFQGLGIEGLPLLVDAGQRSGLPIITEVMEPDQVAAVVEGGAAILQIGARNMQNFPLLRAVGRPRVPVLLKRGLSATIDEWLLAAEYILDAGNPNVILCERGIRTFEPATRNTLDLSAIAVAKRLTHLPVIADPSHATGHHDLVEPMALAAAAAGADGLLIEVHPDPVAALCDGQQALTLNAFAQLMARLARILAAVGRPLASAPSARHRAHGSSQMSHLTVAA